MRCRYRFVRMLLTAALSAVFILSAVGLLAGRRESAVSRCVTNDLISEAVSINTPTYADEGSGSSPGLSGPPTVSGGAGGKVDAEETACETAPITVDFEVLRQKNEDIVAWLYCPDTPINYPILQADDNSYYLHRLVNGTQNESGSLFLDYRSSPGFTDRNSVVYGHNMVNDTMFGTLTEYRKQEYYDKHPVMWLLTPECDYRIELIAGYVTPADGEIYDTFSMTEEARGALLESILKVSDFDTVTQLASGDRFLTLSTCAYDYDNARYVVVGVMRETHPTED